MSDCAERQRLRCHGAPQLQRYRAGPQESPVPGTCYLKQSKTDSFWKGVGIFVGCTGTDICPVAVLLNYLAVGGPAPGPQYIFSDGRMLTRQRFIDRVCNGLAEIRVDQTAYCGHSFRIGAATTAAVKGIEDCIIKMLGRWASLAYLQYVKIPREQLTGYSATRVS